MSRSRRGGTAGVALAMVLMPLSSTMLAVALPEVIAEFDITLGTATWLVTGYLTVMVVFQPVAGWLGDRFHRRNLLFLGLSGFMVSSLLAGQATDFLALCWWRLAQAVTGAMIVPNAMALVSDDGHRDIGSRLGGVASVLTAGAAVGPLIGGFLVELATWRTIFLINVPVALLAIGLLKRHPRPARAGTESAGLPRFEEPGGRLRHLRSIPVASVVAVALSNLTFYSLMLVVPLLLAETVRSTVSGLTAAALSCAAVATSPIGGRLSDKTSWRYPAFFGTALMTAGPLLLVLGTTNVLFVTSALLLAGAGVGLATPALQRGAISSTDHTRVGSTMGVLSTSRSLGGAGGALLLGQLPHDDGDYSTLLWALVASALISALVVGAPRATCSRRLAGAVTGRAASNQL